MNFISRIKWTSKIKFSSEKKNENENTGGSICWVRQMVSEQTFAFFFQVEKINFSKEKRKKKLIMKTSFAMNHVFERKRGKEDNVQIVNIYVQCSSNSS